MHAVLNTADRWIRIKIVLDCCRGILDSPAHSNLRILHDFFQLIEFLHLSDLCRLNLFQQLSLFIFHLLDSLFFFSYIPLFFIGFPGEEILLGAFLILRHALILHGSMLSLFSHLPCSNHFLGQVFNSGIDDLSFAFFFDLLSLVKFLSFLLDVFFAHEFASLSSNSFALSVP